MRFFKPTEDAERPAEATDKPLNDSRTDREENQVSNVQESLSKVMDVVDGAIGVALVDFDGGLTLGTAGGGGDLT